MRVERTTERVRGCAAERPELGRRQLLLAIVGLPVAAALGRSLAGCSRQEERVPTPAPGGAASAPQRPAAEPAPAPGASGSAEQAAPADALVTEVDAMKPTVAALQYVNESTHADQRCSSCQFFSEKTPQRGSCQLFTQGLVAAGGWCTSWTKRAAGA